MQQYLSGGRRVIGPAVRTGGLLAVHADVEGGTSGGQGTPGGDRQLVPGTDGTHAVSTHDLAQLRQ